jgi:hypothetical protein
VHASHREQRWEPPSASLIERDPEVIPDLDIAAKVGKDLFLDEKIPRHGSGQGYVRVAEHSVLWKEREASKVFTYQGLTTCTEVDRSWTIMSTAYNHVRSKRGEDERSMEMFIREEVEHQERLHNACIRELLQEVNVNRKADRQMRLLRLRRKAGWAHSGIKKSVINFARRMSCGKQREMKK